MWLREYLWRHWKKKLFIKKLSRLIQTLKNPFCIDSEEIGCTRSPSEDKYNQTFQKGLRCYRVDNSFVQLDCISMHLTSILVKDLYRGCQLAASVSGARSILSFKHGDVLSIILTRLIVPFNDTWCRHVLPHWEESTQSSKPVTYIKHWFLSKPYRKDESHLRLKGAWSLVDYNYG